MSDTKCPVCNVGYVHKSVNYWYCDYEYCPSYDETDLKTYDILIRTRKALDVAVDALDAGRTLARIAGFEMLATGMDEAVNKITALEQKDVK